MGRQIGSVIQNSYNLTLNSKSIPHPKFGYYNFRFVISDPKNLLGIRSCTRKYQVEINLGLKESKVSINFRIDRSRFWRS